ncbi:MAG TPA: heavy metal translocating P-type ATPase [Clostridia bacterium]
MNKIYKLKNLDCAVCAGKIEQDLKKMFKNAALNFAAQKLYIETEQDIDSKELLSIINKTIKSREPEASAIDITQKHKDKTKKSVFTIGLFVKIFGAVLLAAAFTLELADILSGYRLISLYIAAYLMISYSVLIKFFKNLARLQLFDENFLMTAATIGAFVLGEYFEGVSIMLFYQVGEFLQDLAVERSRGNIKKLLDKQQHSVSVIDENNNVNIAHPETVNVGDKILIKAGETVALDGIVASGTSMLDTSSLTGESAPVMVKEGDEILSGSINLQNTLVANVTRRYKESTASRIADLVEKAASQKSKSEQFITKFSKFYTPAVVGIALFIGVILPLAFGFQADKWSTFGRTALTFLIVSCPCALVISIPVSFFCGIGAASKYGVLFKGANYLETLSNVDAFIFDKTGTLTTGVFEVVQIIPDANYTQEEVLALAAMAETYSQHPLAKAVLDKYAQAVDVSKILSHKDFVGLGIKTDTVEGEIIAGSREFLKNNGIIPPEYFGTVIYVAKNNEYAGALILEDKIKPEAQESVLRLKKLGVKNTVMITGDNAEVALSVSQKVGIDAYHAKCLPEDKLNIVSQYIEKGHKTAFVGEGINDVLAISRADIGISMGTSGSDVSVDSADMVIMNDNLNALPAMVSLSKYTKKIVLLNIVLVLAVKLIIMIINFIPSLQSLILAELADVGVALAAVLIAQTILRYNPKKIKNKKSGV